MRILSFPENVWSVEAAGQELRISLVRLFMGKKRVLKTLSVPDASALPQALGKTSNRVFLSLARDQGIVRQLQLPVDIQHDLKSALTLQIEAISAWPEQEVYWDYVAGKTPDKPKLLTITVVVIPKVVLDPWLQRLESSRIPLAGASLTGFDVNVIPQRLRRGSARVQIAGSYILAACVLIVAAAFLIRPSYQERIYAAQIQREISRLEPEVKSLVKEEAELSALTKRYEALFGYSRRRDSNLEALNTLATVLPPDTFLLNYRYQDGTVTVSGISASALAVQTALEQTAVFKDVQFASPITRDATGKDRFALKMSIEARP